ncbi:MAG: hypothetical protein U0R49_10865, partial [Fimbriimonadales bacterium]
MGDTRACPLFLMMRGGLFLCLLLRQPEAMRRVLAYGNDDLGKRTTFKYDSSGNRTTVTPPPNREQPAIKAAD